MASAKRRSTFYLNPELGPRIRFADGDRDRDRRISSQSVGIDFERLQSATCKDARRFWIGRLPYSIRLLEYCVPHARKIQTSIQRSKIFFAFEDTSA